MSVHRASGELALVIVCSIAGCGSPERTLPGLAIGPVPDKEAPLPTAKLPAPDYQQALGTPHPVQRIAAADSGRWVVACQARSDTDGRDGIRVTVGYHGEMGGDAMVPYFFRGGGDGQPIEDLVGASRDDRWVALLREGKLVLVDDLAGTETTIVAADTRPDQEGYGRVASFDHSGKRLVYFRRVDDVVHIVVRDLERQREREVVIPKIVPWRVVPESTGSWARLLFVRDDTDHNGRLDWPSVDTNAPLGEACTGPAASYSTFGAQGDEIQRAWINLDTGEVRESKSILAHLDNDEISKAPDRSIRVGRTTIVPASCDGELLEFARDPLRLVVTCAASGKSAPVELFGPKFHAKLESTSNERGGQLEARLARSPYFCSDSETCNSLDTGKPVKLRGRIVTIWKERILTREDETYVVTDGESHQLLGIEGYPVAAAGDYMAIDTSIIDITKARVVGEAPRRPFAVDMKGRALVPSRGGDREFPAGPLHWSEPAPVTADVTSNPAPEATWTIEGTVVDEQGKPAENALVAVSEVQLDTSTGDITSPEGRWIPQGVAAKGLGGFVGFSQYVLAARTDVQGRFTWSPVLPGPHAIVVVADDARVGSIDTIRKGESNLKIVLRAPASLRVTCKGVKPMSADMGAGGVTILAGVRRMSAACGDTIGGLPAGHYVLATKQDRGEYAGFEVDLRSGQTNEAVLQLRPSGRIQGRVVEHPGDKPVAGVSCEARWRLGDIGGDPGSTSKEDGTFELKISQGRIQIWCEGDDFARGEANADLGPTPARVTVRVVRLRPDAVDVGADVEAETDGARVTKVRKRAARSGLQAGDLVRAVDNIPLAGLSRRSMAALAFFWPRDASPTWTVVRDGKTLVIRAKH